MITGSASNKDHSSTSSHHAQVCLQSSKRDRMSIEVDSSPHRVDDRFGLLVDLLLHKVIERSLHDRSQFDLQGFDGTNGRDSVITSKSMNMEF